MVVEPSPNGSPTAGLAKISTVASTHTAATITIGMSRLRLRLAKATDSPATRPISPLPISQIGNTPQPISASPSTLPTKPLKKPTAGPNTTPKKIGITIAGRSATLLTEGSWSQLVAQLSTPYSAAPIAA